MQKKQRTSGVRVPDSMQSAMAKRALEQLTFVQRVKAAGAHEQAS